jgi:hypothetical protein
LELLLILIFVNINIRLVVVIKSLHVYFGGKGQIFKGNVNEFALEGLVRVMCLLRGEANERGLNATDLYPEDFLLGSQFFHVDDGHDHPTFFFFGFSSHITILHSVVATE